MKVCSQCKKEKQSVDFCDAKCKMRYYRKNVTRKERKAAVLREAGREALPKENKTFKVGCKLHGLKDCPFGTCTNTS